MGITYPQTRINYQLGHLYVFIGVALLKDGVILHHIKLKEICTQSDCV